jgi:hypothetical protein
VCVEWMGRGWHKEVTSEVGVQGFVHTLCVTMRQGSGEAGGQEGGGVEQSGTRVAGRLEANVVVYLNLDVRVQMPNVCPYVGRGSCV